MRVFFLILLILTINACNTSDKTVKREKKKENNCYSDIDKLLPEDTEILLYLDMGKLKNISVLKSYTEYFKEKYFLKNTGKFFMALTDFYNNQDFFIYSEQLRFEGGIKYKFDNVRLVKKFENEAGIFSFWNFNNKEGIFGKFFLIDGILNNCKKGITSQFYQKVKESGFYENNSYFKLFLSFNERLKYDLSGFLKKSLFLEYIFEDLNYILFEAELQKDNMINLTLKISKSNPVDEIFEIFNDKYKFLITEFKKKNVEKNIFFEQFKVKKANKNLLILSLKLKVAQLGNLLKLIKLFTINQ